MRKGCLLLLLSILLNGYSGMAAAQSNSDYLQTLQGEASNLNLDKETKVEEKKEGVSSTASSVSKGWGGQAGAIVELTPGLSIDQFETVLKNNYIGSYLFYKRLDNSRKDEVFRFYQENPDPSIIRNKILQVSKK